MLSDIQFFFEKVHHFGLNPYMASIMRKGTFGRMQKVKTQISRCVSDAASDQGLHFLTPGTSMVLISLAA